MRIFHRREQKLSLGHVVYQIKSRAVLAFIFRDFTMP